MKTTETLIYFLLCMHLSSADLRASGHSFFAALDQDEKVKLYWNVSTANKEIAFTVEAKTTGWIGFGISSGQGKMEGADIGDRLGSPWDWSRETPDRFTAGLRADIPGGEGTAKLIYAFHPDDPASENDIPQHDPKNRGVRSTFLLNSVENEPTLPDDTKTFNFTNNKRALSSKRTTYWYGVFEFPKLQKRHDIIQIDPIIQEGNEGVVHHMLLYECSDDFPRSNISWEGDLDSPDMPPAVNECRGFSMLAGWGIGGQSFYYPEHVGFAIGTRESPKIAVMEIHYDNYEHKQGIVDSSGFRFSLHQPTEKVPGWVFFCWVQWLGSWHERFTITWGRDSDIFFNSSHALGRKGVELPEISRDDHYDANFQEFQIPSKEITVLPGDSLITVCRYETGNEMIEGGLSTGDEMCLSFHQYYPKVNLTRCWSKQRAGWEKFRDTYGVPNSPSGWSDKLVSELRKSYQETDEIYAYCNGRNSNQLPGLGKKLVSKPVIL
ncbi:DBH-like monooxygenase protein 1 [Desmophyllum pertusum]|uniref:DBH-like monooxygenase protein 1 n=1 Tax=Desmophyllum pertusum TaxID=174260 RepID=A0A9W9ZKA0_9CNID|nr:DBH-like monooxygenase protein 1 [Desmophyllum pertusum]